MYKKTVWYAAAKGIRWTGPFKTEREAWMAVRQVREDRNPRGPIHLPGAHVWPRKEGEDP